MSGVGAVFVMDGSFSVRMFVVDVVGEHSIDRRCENGRRATGGNERRVGHYQHTTPWHRPHHAPPWADHVASLIDVVIVHPLVG
jgi:cbb3-type cytochrome oxidase cytochrome c subunit